MVNYCNEKEVESNWIYDVLESVFENLRLGKEYERAYFLPKLREEKLELLERKLNFVSDRPNMPIMSSS